MKVFFVRHGQSVANLEKVYAGQCDVPLSDQGRKEAAAIAPVLASVAFDRVYSSDLSRAIETQRIALPGAEGIRTPLIREIDVGSLVGKPFGTAKTLSETGEPDYTPFGGENAVDVCNRVKKFLDILAQDPCENVAVFAHNGVMNTMLRIVLGVAVDPSAVRTNNCGIHVFEYMEGKWRLLAWNYMGNV